MERMDVMSPGMQNISKFWRRMLAKGWDRDKISLLMEWRIAYERHMAEQGKALILSFEKACGGQPRSVRMLNLLSADDGVTYRDVPMYGHNRGPRLDS